LLIKLGYNMEFEVGNAVPIVAMVNVHPSRAADLRQPDELHLDPAVPTEQYIDSFGNLCTRFVAPPGRIRLLYRTLIEDSGEPDAVDQLAEQCPVEKLPPEMLRFLMPSRYCEVDRLGSVAADLFGETKPGWSRVATICDWVHEKVQFGYQFARSTKTALDTYTERAGVCRDFQHLAITFCRCMNIPVRYATGYLGDIGVPSPGTPMDFSAWFEAYLGGRWWAFDARHNMPRIGRILMATGLDAADVALTTSFGAATLRQFHVVTDEVTVNGHAADTAVSGDQAAAPPVI
jgi:transglutaminase-like putative cysteine protease